MISLKNIEITKYKPGAIGRITELHAEFYNKQSGFGLFFEAKVATELSEFLSRFDESHDGMWLANLNSQIVGSIFIDGKNADTEGAHLRWFIVSPAYQGQGIGNLLINNTIEFCKSNNYYKIFLWTFSGLNAARYLYEKNQFKLKKEEEGKQWGVVVKEQLFELNL